MSGWEDVVTTGLIGTDRRRMPDDLPASWAAGLDQELDPAHAVLSLAARHRAASRAGNPLRSCPPAPVGGPPLAAYGMYGYALMCSPTMREFFHFAVRYQPLATPALRLEEVRHVVENYDVAGLGARGSARWKATTPKPRLRPTR